jgi:hypothetical protein
VAFTDLLNKYLEEYNASPIEGVIYQQYNICEKKGIYYISEGNRIIRSTKTLKEAKELVDSITSGC